MRLPRSRRGGGSRAPPSLLHEGLGCSQLLLTAPRAVGKSGNVRTRSAVLQLQAGNPLVPAAALGAEAADVLQSLTLHGLHGGVLHERHGERGGHFTAMDALESAA